MRVLLAALAILLCPAMAKAETTRDFCQSAKKDLKDDVNLSAAAKAVFPRATFAARDDDCIFPIKVLRYSDADVLMTAGNTPGEACHGCAASLSAYVLRRSPTGPHLVAKFVGFDEAGTSGNPGNIDATQIAGHDAFAVEAGGIFQGYASTQVSFYLFQSGRIDRLTPSIPLSADDTGAMTDEKKIVTVDGGWHVDPKRPDAVTFVYEVSVKGRTTKTITTWRLIQNQLTLTAGRTPAELDTAGGK